jgi:hypothetical protein
MWKMTSEYKNTSIDIFELITSHRVPMGIGLRQDPIIAGLHIYVLQYLPQPVRPLIIKSRHTPYYTLYTGMVKNMFRLKAHALFPFLLQAAYIPLGIILFRDTHDISLWMRILWTIWLYTLHGIGLRFRRIFLGTESFLESIVHLLVQWRP